MLRPLRAGAAVSGLRVYCLVLIGAGCHLSLARLSTARGAKALWAKALWIAGAGAPDSPFDHPPETFLPEGLAGPRGKP